MIRRLLQAVLAVGVFGSLTLAGVFLLSEFRLRHVDAPGGFVAEIPGDPETIAYGRHVARIRGCFGCHGQQLQGAVFTEQWPWVERAVAPNLAEYAREHSPAVLEAAIRQGIGRDGRALWSMPSYNWANLSDADLIALIAYLRSAEVITAELPAPKLGWRARWRIATGADEHMAAWVKMVPELQFADHPDPAIRRGEYLAMTMCNECHGLDLRGADNADGSAPDLAVLGAYTDEDFRVLMKTGTALGGRDKLNLMSMIARDRFSALTEEELTSLLTFLRTLPERPLRQNAPWRNQTDE